jgi:hypothetical protein
MNFQPTGRAEPKGLCLIKQGLLGRSLATGLTRCYDGDMMQVGDIPPGELFWYDQDGRRSLMMIVLQIGHDWARKGLMEVPKGGLWVPPPKAPIWSLEVEPADWWDLKAA